MLRGVSPERSEGLSMTGLDLSVGEEPSRSFEPCLNCSFAPVQLNLAETHRIADFDARFLQGFRYSHFGQRDL